jgi:hypothetical protein
MLSPKSALKPARSYACAESPPSNDARVLRKCWKSLSEYVRFVVIPFPPSVAVIPDTSVRGETCFATPHSRRSSNTLTRTQDKS